MYQKQQRREILNSNLRKKVIVNLRKRRAFTFRIFLFLYIKKKKRLLSLSSLALDTKRNNTDKWNWFNNNTSLLELTCFVFIVMQRFHHSNKNIFYSSPSDWLTSFTSSNVIGQLFIIVIAVVQTFCYGSKQKLFFLTQDEIIRKNRLHFFDLLIINIRKEILLYKYIVISFTPSK